MFKKSIILLSLISLAACNQPVEKIVSYPSETSPSPITTPEVLKEKTIKGKFSIPYTYFGEDLSDKAQGASCSAVPYDGRIRSFNNSGFSFNDQVTLKDSQGTIIGIYTMNDGILVKMGEQKVQNIEGKIVTVRGNYNFNCEVPFEFTNVRDSPFYQISTSNKTITISREDLDAENWNLELTIGSWEFN